MHRTARAARIHKLTVTPICTVHALVRRGLLYAKWGLRWIRGTRNLQLDHDTHLSARATWLPGHQGRVPSTVQDQHAPCELTVTTTSAPADVWPPSASGSRCMAYVPANAASVSDAAGDSAASRLAMLTCHGRQVSAMRFAF